MMLFCEQCGAGISESAKFCAYCGAKTINNKDFSLKRETVNFTEDMNETLNKPESSFFKPAVSMHAETDMLEIASSNKKLKQQTCPKGALIREKSFSCPNCLTAINNADVAAAKRGLFVVCKACGKRIQV